MTKLDQWSVIARHGAAELGSATPVGLQRDLEATFSAHVQRFAEGFYKKGAGEIDCAWYEGRELQFLEVKWATQLRPAELKEMRRQGRGVIAARAGEVRTFDGVTVLPAAVVLLRLSARATTSSR